MDCACSRRPPGALPWGPGWCIMGPWNKNEDLFSRRPFRAWSGCPGRCCPGINKTPGPCPGGRTGSPITYGSARSCFNRPGWRLCGAITCAFWRPCPPSPPWRRRRKGPCLSCGKGWAITAGRGICSGPPSGSRRNSTGYFPGNTKRFAAFRALGIIRRGPSAPFVLVCL